MAQPEMVAPSPAIQETADPMAMFQQQFPGEPPMTAPNGAPMPGFQYGGEEIPGFHAGGSLHAHPHNPISPWGISDNAGTSGGSGRSGWGSSSGGSSWGINRRTSSEPSGTGDVRLDGLVEQLRYEAELEGVVPSESSLIARARALMESDDYNRLQDAISGGGGGSAGPDHFYEEMAFKAAEAEKERRDARQVANVSQKALQQQAIDDYRQNLASADAERKNVANSAIGQAQDTFTNLVGQMEPGQNLLYAPSMGYRTVMNTKGPTWEAPVLPETVFPENWG